MQRVVVTGLGTVSPIGNNVAAFWDSMRHDKGGIAPITKFDHSGSSVSVAGEVKDFGKPNGWTSSPNMPWWHRWKQWKTPATRLNTMPTG